jgi:hypothetical protein
MASPASPHPASEKSNSNAPLCTISYIVAFNGQRLTASGQLLYIRPPPPPSSYSSCPPRSGSGSGPVDGICQMADGRWQMAETMMAVGPRGRPPRATLTAHSVLPVSTPVLPRAALPLLLISPVPEGTSYVSVSNAGSANQSANRAHNNTQHASKTNNTNEPCIYLVGVSCRRTPKTPGGEGATPKRRGSRRTKATQ